MKQAFTPGPWFVGGSDTTTQIWVCKQHGNRICTLKPSEEDLSNARLIAAAPDLLDAAYGVDRVYAELQAALPLIVGTPAFDIVMNAVKQARAVIAKATQP